MNIQNLNDPKIISLIIGIGGIIIWFIISSLSNKKTLHESKIEYKPIKIAGPYSVDEIAQHNKKTDAWVIVDGKVYDVTSYVEDHPGGDSILNHVGGDASEGVHGPQHPDSMWAMLSLYYVGNVKQ